MGGDPDDPHGQYGPRVPVPTWLVVTVIVLAGLVGLSLITGFPGPGALRRYPLSDLNEVADRINNRAARNGTTADAFGGEPAEVDLVTSRVRVSVTVDVCGMGFSSDDLEMIEMKGSGRTPSCGG